MNDSMVYELNKDGDKTFQDAGDRFEKQVHNLKVHSYIGIVTKDPKYRSVICWIYYALCTCQFSE